MRPPVRSREGCGSLRVAHAMLDVSDGIAVDAGHLAPALRLPLRRSTSTGAAAPGAARDLGFGEDYELLAAVDER